MQTRMYQKALANRENLTYTCTTLKEVEDIMNTKPGFIKASWCGNQECEEKMKEINSLIEKPTLNTGELDRILKSIGVIVY